MITGFNTDVEYNGVTYHVQTEDKGLKTPLILSLVYTGGTILASKRTPYDDLVAAGFNEQALAERLQRQHKLICAAIRAGRIEDLKLMNGRSTAKRASTAKGRAKKQSDAVDVKEGTKKRSDAAQPSAQSSANSASQRTPEVPQTPTLVPSAPVAAPVPTVRAATHGVADFARPVADPNSLHVSLLDEKEFRAGELIKLQIRVGRGTEGREAIYRARVTVKLLGTTFPPASYSAITDKAGMAVVQAQIPSFSAGRADLLIRVTAAGYEAELRRIIQASV